MQEQLFAQPVRRLMQQYEFTALCHVCAATYDAINRSENFANHGTIELSQLRDQITLLEDVSLIDQGLENPWAR